MQKKALINFWWHMPPPKNLRLHHFISFDVTITKISGEGGGGAKFWLTPGAT